MASAVMVQAGYATAVSLSRCGLGVEIEGWSLQLAVRPTAVSHSALNPAGSLLGVLPMQNSLLRMHRLSSVGGSGGQMPAD